MSFTPAFLDELRARLPVSDVVGRKVVWDRAKSNPARRDYWACCPFHQEDTASFHADDRMGRYKCFGCGASGDIVTFVMETERLSFPEAVEKLAEEAGLEVPKRAPQDVEAADRRTRLVAAQEAAARFFALELARGDGRIAHAYLREKRGLSDATIKTFGLGYAPRDGGALGRFLADQGVGVEDAVDGGLLLKPEDGGAPFARFRDRVMFPIRDARGRVIAFGGRAMSANAKAKYLNSPETPIFSKGRVLYNLERARTALGPRDGALVVVEGYMDVIALSEAGIGAAVAPLGTAITEDQLRLAWRVSPDVVLALDGDAAGARAAAKALDRALGELGPERRLAFAFLPEGQDPDDLVRAGGEAAFRKILGEAAPSSEMIWRVGVGETGAATPEDRARLRARLREMTGRLASVDLKREVEGLFAARLQSMTAPARTGPGRAPSGPVTRGALDRARAVVRGPGMRASALLVGAARKPDLVDAHLERFAAADLADPFLDSLRDHLISITTSGDVGDVWSAMASRFGEDWRKVADYAAWSAPWARAGVSDEALERGWLEALEAFAHSVENE